MKKAFFFCFFLVEINQRLKFEMSVKSKTAARNSLTWIYRPFSFQITHEFTLLAAS